MMDVAIKANSRRAISIQPTRKPHHKQGQMSSPGSMLGQAALNNLTSNFNSNIPGYKSIINNSADLIQTQQTFESPSSRAKNDIF